MTRTLKSRRCLKKNWLVQLISFCQQNGGLHLVGLNYYELSESGEPASFRWNVDPRFGWSEQYDLTEAVVKDARAQGVLDKHGLVAGRAFVVAGQVYKDDQSRCLVCARVDRIDEADAIHCAARGRALTPDENTSDCKDYRSIIHAASSKGKGKP